LDLYVLGPPGSGSISQSYGSGSFSHKAKKVRKTLIPTVLLLLFEFLSLKNYVNVPSKSNKQKNFFLNYRRFFVGLLKVNDENRDPDPHQKIMDRNIGGDQAKGLLSRK
jgi:hypothetical protein